MFYECFSLKNMNELKYLDTKDVNNYKSMFNGCSSLSDIKYKIITKLECFKWK